MLPLSATTSPFSPRPFLYYLGALLAISGTALLQYTAQTYGPSNNTQHVFETLAKFLSKGQLFIETVPPLTLLAAAHLPAAICHQLGVSSQVIFITLLSSKLLAPDLRSSRWWLGVLCALIYPLTSTAFNQVPPLVDSENVSSCILFFVFLRIPSISSGQGTIVEHVGGALETCVVIAGMLSTNSIDLMGCYLLLALSRLLWVCRRARENVIIHLALTVIRSVLLPPLLVCLAYGTMFPFSEVSAGGNYNLSHLEAAPRRLLSPVVTNTTSCRSSGKLITNRPISLYIQHAGFLWTDSFVWRDDAGIFDKIRSNDDNGTGLPTVGSHTIVESEQQNEPQRVFFADPIARRHPWALEAVSIPIAKPDFLLPREPVHVRSQTTGRYMSVVRGNPSIVDRELGAHIQDSEPFVRFEVGTYPTPFLNGTWILEYDDKQGSGGLRLYHPGLNCYLATSFRTYVDYDGDTGNDTVGRLINRVSEAVCTRGVSRAASWFEVIEGNTQRCSQQNPISWLRRGWFVARATTSLYQWRRLYGNTLELPDPFAQQYKSGTGSHFERIVLASFVLLRSMRTLGQKRRHSWKRRQTRQPIVPISISSISVVLVWLHVGRLLLSGFGWWDSSTLVVGLSLLGIQEMLLEILITER